MHKSKGTPQVAILLETRMADAKERLISALADDKSTKEGRKALQREYENMLAKYQEKLFGNSRKEVYALQRSSESEEDNSKKVEAATRAAVLSCSIKLSGDSCVVCEKGLNKYRVQTSCGHIYCATCAPKLVDGCSSCGQTNVTATSGGKYDIQKRYHIPGMLVPTTRRAVPMPIISLNKGSCTTEFWVATNFPPDNQPFLKSTKTLSTARVHGWSDGFNVFPYRLSTDVYVFQADPGEYKRGNIIRTSLQPCVGRSVHLPVIVASESVASGLYRHMYTGAISPDFLMDDEVIDLKQAYAGVVDFKLVSFCNTDIKIYKLNDALYGDISLLRAWAAAGLTPNQRPARKRLLSQLNVQDEVSEIAWAADGPISTSTVDIRVGGKTHQVPISYTGNPTDAQKKKIARNIFVRAERPPILKLAPRGTDAERAKSGKVSLEKYKSLQEDYRKTQRELQTMAGTIRANACDDMAITGRAPFLRSILLPDEGAVSIPDGNMRQHYNKSETVTGNFTVGSSGSGLFIVYPEHPTDLIANHYVSTPTGYVFDSTLLTAQDLKESYDYSRRSSQILTFRSSTLPSGVYALNGTFNAVRIEGSTSQVPGLQDTDLYNSILTNTADPLDKIGNVLVGDGIAVLSMNGAFGNPYTRLGDYAPFQVLTGRFSANPPQVTDRSEDLLYSYSTIYDTALPVGASTISDVTFNIDSTTGVNYQIDVLGSGLVDAEMSADVIVTFIDPFGNIKSSRTQSVTATTTPDGNVSFNFVGFVDTAVGNNAPLGSIRLVVMLSSDVAQPDGLNFTVGASYVVPVAARPGVVWPIVMVTYSGVAPGSIITTTGITNFELIPNPSLRQNLPLNGGRFDDNDRKWTQRIMSDRRKFGIRSIWNLKDYIRDRPLLAEMADMNVNTRAEAFDFGSLLGTLKQTFLPALKGAGIAALHSLASSGPYIGAAASGSVIRGRAASGDIILPKNFMFQNPSRAYAADGEIAWAMDRPWSTDRSRNKRNRAIIPKDDRMVAFPVIVTAAGLETPVRSQLYVASTVDFAKFRPEVKTRDGSFHVQGQETLPEGFHLNRNIYVCPVDPDRFPKIVPIPGPIVRGASSDGAIWLACNGNFQGVLPFAVTGAVQAPHTLLHNDHFERKLDFCKRHNVALAGNSEDADVIVEDLKNIPNFVRTERQVAE